MTAALAKFLDQRWRLVTVTLWLLFVAGMLYWYWGRVHWFSLGDTDDNLRMMQVRAWLKGQDWYDLRQYRLSPPQGFNIHWSRLVDLPIAGIILATKPFLGGPNAERAAIALAPLLPMLVVLGGLTLTVRRLVAPAAYPIALVTLLAASTTLSMFVPARIDHHNWQLAMVAVILAGLADPKQRRGGLTVGVATALSLVIGLEMMPYLGLAGIAIALRWIWDGGQAPRLGAYAVSLAGGSALGFLLFASNDNWKPVCDALSPPWMGTMVLAGGLLFVLARLPLQSRIARLGAAGAAGAIVAGVFAGAWPQCLGKPEGVSPELQREWLDRIREARPITKQDWRSAVMMATLPAVGLIGGSFALWANRRDPQRLAGWASILLLSTCGFALLFLQIRAAAAAQLLAVPAGAALIWWGVPPLRASKSVLVRVLGTVLLILGASGLLVPFIIGLFPKDKETKGDKAVNKAGASCTTIPSMAPLTKIPPATMLTLVDLGPRLITLTKHSALAGPYHRNGEQILDVHRAFEGNDDTARAVIRKYRATMVLICPNYAEATNYRADAPKGFYARLEKGQAPGWLEPVSLPAKSPFKLWRVKP